MSYERLKKLLPDENIDNAIAFSSDSFLIEHTIRILDDFSSFNSKLDDNTVKALYRMICMYSNVRLSWIDYESKDIESLAEKSVEKIYYVHSDKIDRIATTNEINNGVSILEVRKMYPIGQEDSELFYLWAWSETGKSYYYRQAGFKQDYIDNKPIEEFYPMLMTSIVKIDKLIKLLNNMDKMNEDIKILKKIKKIKYPTYMKDEVNEKISPKQLIYSIYKGFPRGSSNVEYRKALAMSFRNIEENKRLEPYEVAELRRIYAKFLENGDTREPVQKVKEACEYLLEQREKGTINGKEFVFKIVGTLKKGNYCRCSEKQFNIISEAVEKCKNRQELEQTVITDTNIDAVVNNTIDDSDIGELPW